MPNRILRDWTDSEKMNALDAPTERFFTRLIMKADDYGRFNASAKLLRCNLYPLLIDEICEDDISGWLAACHKAGLIALYEVDSKPYLQVENFNQRLRSKREKYPAPTGGVHVANHARPEVEVEVETETEVEVETERNRKPVAAKTIDEKIKLLAGRALRFKEILRGFVSEYPMEMLEDFFQYWSECNPSYTKLRFEMEKTWEVQKRLATWAGRSKQFNKTNKHGQNSNTRKGQPDTGAIRKVARKILESAGGGEDNN
jgi:hypothetical protein